MRPNSKATLSAYCLRWLGAPILNIEVTEEQLSDRIDDAMDFFIKNHYSGSQEVVRRIIFTAGDEIRQSMTLPDDFIAISEIFEPNHSFGDGSGEEFENLNFLLAQGDSLLLLRGNSSMERNLTGYHMTLAYLSTINRYFNPMKSFSFNQLSGRASFPGAYIKEGNFILVKGWTTIDSFDTGITKLWDDEWLKMYATQLIKRQWGENLKKYDNIQMVGGVTVNGQVIFDEAQTAIDKLRDDFMKTNSAPVDFFWG